MKEENPRDIMKYISYDLVYWKNFFLKKEENEIDSVEIKTYDSFQLKNIKINNKMYDGLIKLDSHKCPYFCKNFIIHKEGKKYVGNFKTRKLTGYGKILSNNSYYKGYIYNGKKNKKGKYVFNKKLVYKGYWKNDKRNGYGILKFLNEKKKLIYKGYWKKNQRNYYGIQYYENKSVYNGYWKKNKRYGFGKITWYCNRKKKVNQFINTYENIYLKKNEIQKKENANFFIMKYKEKNIIENMYIGEWMNDKQHGFGIYIWFKKNRNKIIYQNENYDKYVGYWNKGKRNGYGIFYYNNGNKYIGIWKNNKKNGYGYLIKINGIVSKCLYKNNELILEKQINKTCKINYINTNSLYSIIDLSFFKRIYNITNKNIEFFYKIIYKNFEFLVEIYDYYKRRNEKKKKGIFNSFKLLHLWKIFYRSKIINTEFTLNSLNNLIIDYSLLIEEEKLFKLLEINSNNAYPFNEKDIIECFFKSIDCLNIFPQGNIINKKNYFIYKSNIRSTEKYADQENVNLCTCNIGNNDKEYNSINTNNDSNTTNNNINDNIVDEEFIIHHENNLNNDSNYLKQNKDHLKRTFDLLKNILFNKNLLYLKDCTNFYKYHCKHCCHRNENNFILKKIYLFILRNKRKNNKHFLYYVLVSVFQCVPLLHNFFYIDKKCTYSYSSDIFISNFYLNNEFKDIKKNKLKENSDENKRNNIKKKCIPFSNFYELLNNKNCVAYLKKLIIFINLNRCYIHDENRKISFHCFLSTLIHISMRLNNLNNINKTLDSLMNTLKTYSQKKKELCNNNFTKKKDKEIKINITSFHRKRYKKYKEKKDAYISVEKDGRNLKNNKNGMDQNKKEKIKYNKHKMKGINKKSEENISINTCSICCDALNKNCKKKNCKFCIKRKSNFLYEEKWDKVLINILKNYIYYFMFYFLIFKSKEKKISIFSMKLNISIRLRDILLFLIKLKLLKKKSRHKNKVKCINLTYFTYYKKKRKKKKKENILLSNIYHNKEEFLEMKSEMKNKNGKTCDEISNLNRDNIEKSKEKEYIKYKSVKNWIQNIKNECNTRMFSHDKVINNENNENYENEKWKNKKTTKDNNKNHNNKFNKNENEKNKVNQMKDRSQKEKSDNTKMCKKRLVKNIKVLIFKKFSKMFYLSFHEILSIFSDIFNSKNLHLVNEPCVHLYLSKLKEKKKKMKINKYHLKNNIIHYFMILKEKEENVLLTKSNRKHVYIDESSNYHKKISQNYICTFHNRRNQIEINTIDEKWNLLEHSIEEPIFKNGNTLNILDLVISKNIRNRSDTQKNVRYIKKNNYLMENQCDKLMKNEPIFTNIFIKRKNEIKKKLYALRKYMFSHKNYISVLDYFNIYVTPYELLLFFLKFVKRIKKKRKIKNSCNDMLYFFIFYILLYKSSILANKNSKYKKDKTRNMEK